MIESTTKTLPNTDENELKNQLLETEKSSDNAKPNQNVVNAININSFSCPEFVLNFLQDKPIKIQKMVLTAKLTQDQKKSVESIFQAGPHEIEINRAALKAIIEKLAIKYPEVQPWLTNEAVFLGTFAFGFYDRAEQVKTVLEAERLKNV